MAVHDNIGSSKDPHMKSPAPRFILIIIVIGILCFVGYKAYEILSEENDRTEERSKNNEKSEVKPREK